MRTELGARMSYTGARADTGANVPGVPAAGQQDTFTDREPQG